MPSEDTTNNEEWIMGFGQFSVTSTRRTKADQLETAKEQGYIIATSRKAGHNRVHFTASDGSEHFMLHLTVIASLNAERTRLILNDGGWPSITTRAAFSEAASAFKLPALSVSGGRPKASHLIWQNKIAFDRTVALSFDANGYYLAPDCQPVSDPMLRAIVNGETSLEVTYRNGEVISNNGDKFVVSPTRLIITLADMLTLAKKSSRFIGWRNDPINYEHELPIFRGALVAYGGRFGRAVHVGCHEFNVADIRNILQRLKIDYPEAAANAKAFLKARKATVTQPEG